MGKDNWETMDRIGMLMPEKVKLVQIYRVVINKPNELLVETLFLMRNWTGNEFLVISFRGRNGITCVTSFYAED